MISSKFIKFNEHDLANSWCSRRYLPQIKRTKVSNSSMQPAGISCTCRWILSSALANKPGLPAVCNCELHLTITL